MSDGIGVSSAVAWPTAEPYVAPVEDDKPHIWGQKGFQFHDLLDIVNPLQHLPVIGSVYRWITGDTIGNLPRVVGDTLYGGLIGFASGLANVLIKEQTGHDIGETVVALVTGDDKPSAVASVPSAPAAPAAPADHPAATPAHGAGTSVSAAPAASAPANPAQTFLAQQAERRRQLYGSSSTAANGRVLSAQVIPLSIPPGSLSPPARAMPVAYTASAPAPTPTQAGGTGPVDVSQKMIDALDKYATLQRQREGTSTPRGSQVDVAP